MRISGELGSEVVAFQAGATFTDIANAVQLLSDATGVTAQVVGSQLELTSANYGTDAYVDVEVISEGVGGTFETNLSAQRKTGTNISAIVNGVGERGTCGSAIWPRSFSRLRTKSKS